MTRLFYNTREQDLEAAKESRHHLYQEYKKLELLIEKMVNCWGEKIPPQAQKIADECKQDRTAKEQWLREVAEAKKREEAQLLAEAEAELEQAKVRVKKLKEGK